MSKPANAFVLGAGLGTRLRPLTEFLPKPLVPVWQRPLITYAFDHLVDSGVRRIMVNTHWHPEAYEAVFTDRLWGATPIEFRHEPVLLETGGGIANVADWLGREESFWVYNGDILATLPLEPALAAHAASDAIATLVLRSSGPEPVITFDESTGRIVDIRNLLRTGAASPLGFTGIYLCRPEFLEWVTPGRIVSSRTIFLEIIRQTGRLGGVVVDGGRWLDLGDRTSYLAAHRVLAAEFGIPAPAGAAVSGICSIDQRARVDPEATLIDSIVWAGGRVAAGAHLTRCIVRSGQNASGTAVDRDF